MPVFNHLDLPIHQVPRIRTRILASHQRGTQETAVWEQWIDEGGYIPLHYHEIEEVLVLMSGEVLLTLDNETTVVCAPATVVVPAQQTHEVRLHGSTTAHLLAFFPSSSPTIFAVDGTKRPLPWQDHKSES